ncbi:MAG: diguanylate cyclase [Alphaproteobacteria bacterium]|nr:diguanylate cyclase [Alphaproteobacteria bacterium]
MIIDREEAAAQMTASKLEALYHQVTVEPSKENAVHRAVSDQTEIFLIDPTPINSARSFILSLRRNVTNYPYIFAFGNDVSLEDAIKAGANDVFLKPVDPTVFDEKLENAASLISLVDRIGDDSEDFPSAGGVIAKSAFNQLFLSALDRADRYGERTYVLFISVSNYKDILEMDGAYAADYAVAKLSQYLVRLRRQSDIIGQTAKYEYALLLQRPAYENEPVEAANRFAESLSQCKDIVSSGSTPVEITVKLIDLPVGRICQKHVLTPAQAE